jgi:hypothetical protein
MGDAMTVLPFTGCTKRFSAGVPGAAVPAMVSGSFACPSGRSGTFLGTNRLQRCTAKFGQLAAAGVDTGQLFDADGEPIGFSARRKTTVADVIQSRTALLVRTRHGNVDLLDFDVDVRGVHVDVQGPQFENAVRVAFELTSQLLDERGARRCTVNDIRALRPSRPTRPRRSW